MAFVKAVKHDAKLRLSIQGPSGAGKTFTALTIATAMNTGKPIALVDTEHGSATKYADLFEFDVMEMEAPFHPDKYAEAIRDAAQAGYGVIILDSLTHAWKGEGGLLEEVTAIAKRKYAGNTYAAWNDAGSIQKRMVEAIVSAPIHVIATMRSKMDYVQEKDDKGRTNIKKVGMAPEQRDDMQYEFDVVLDMDTNNEAIVSKTRCSALSGKVITKPGKQVAETLVKWLAGSPQPVQTAIQDKTEATTTVSESSKDKAIPTTFKDGDAAIKWGYTTGAFDAYQHSENAYNKLKEEKKPKTAADMFRFWTENVQQRMTEKAQPVTA